MKSKTGVENGGRREYVPSRRCVAPGRRSHRHFRAASHQPRAPRRLGVAPHSRNRRTRLRPPDAGSIPADPKLFGGLSVRERLQVHKRNATCATCHSRIDPLGFPLEHFDSTGRWREKYSEGKTIDDYGDLSDNTRISGIDGLLEYLETASRTQVQRTLAHKLIGYALGRTIQLSDQPLDRENGRGWRQSRLFGDLVSRDRH